MSLSAFVRRTAGGCGSFPRQNSGTDLNPRMERAKKLVKATPPRGEEYLGMLETVLQRESAWTKWKDVRRIYSRAYERSTISAGFDTHLGKPSRYVHTGHP